MNDDKIYRVLFRAPHKNIEMSGKYKYVPHNPMSNKRNEEESLDKDKPNYFLGREK